MFYAEVQLLCWLQGHGSFLIGFVKQISNFLSAPAEHPEKHKCHSNKKSRSQKSACKCQLGLIGSKGVLVDWIWHAPDQHQLLGSARVDVLASKQPRTHMSKFAAHIPLSCFIILSSLLSFSLLSSLFCPKLQYMRVQARHLPIYVIPRLLQLSTSPLQSSLTVVDIIFSRTSTLCFANAP